MTNSNLWSDKKRYFGKRLSFTKYTLSENRLFIETGLISKELLEYRLFRISELKLKQTLFQRIFNEGDIELKTDTDDGTIMLHNVFDPKHVMDLISEKADYHRSKRVKNLERFAFGSDEDDE